MLPRLIFGGRRPADFVYLDAEQVGDYNVDKYDLITREHAGPVTTTGTDDVRETHTKDQILRSKHQIYVYKLCHSILFHSPVKTCALFFSVPVCVEPSGTLHLLISILVLQTKNKRTMVFGILFTLFSFKREEPEAFFGSHCLL